jgi:outer membrane protein TolC
MLLIAAGANGLGSAVACLDRSETKASTKYQIRSHSLTQAELETVLHGRPMKLDDAIAISMLASRPLGAAMANLTKAVGGVAEVKSGLLPQLSVGVQAAEFDKANVIDLGSLMHGPSLPLTIANQWNPSMFAGLTMQIDISGAVRSATSQMEFIALAARIDVDRVRNQLALDVRSSFFQAIRANSLVGVARDNLNAAQDRLHDAKSNESVGNAPKFDVISAERDVAQAQQMLVGARSQVSLALAALKNVIGVDQSAHVSISTDEALANIESPTVETAQSAQNLSTVEDETPYGPYYEEIVQQALKLRPEVLESAAAVAAAKRGIQFARRSTQPSLSAGLGYTYQPNNGAFTLENSAVATLSLSIPIFDGGLAKARMKEAGADLAQCENNYRAATDQVKLEVQNAYVNMLQSKERIHLADVGLVQAREAFRIAQERYTVGVSQSSVVSPQLELSTAQAGLTTASSNRVNALIDYRIAEATLEHAIGSFARLQAKPLPAVAR